MHHVVFWVDSFIKSKKHALQWAGEKLVECPVSDWYRGTLDGWCMKFSGDYTLIVWEGDDETFEMMVNDAGF